ETTRLERLLGEGREAVTLDNALGLMDPAQRTPPTQPSFKARPATLSGYADLPPLVTPAAAAIRQSLDALIAEHRDDPVTFETPHGPRELLLGEMGNWSYRLVLTAKSDGATMPLQELWERWWTERPAELRDTDGLELLRALAMPNQALIHPLARQHVPDWLLTTASMLSGQPEDLKYP